MQKRFEHLLDLIFVGSGYLAACFLVGICALVIAQILGRLFGVVVPSADEFAGYCLAATSFLALAYTLRSNSHIRVSLVLSRLPSRLRTVFEIGCVFTALGVSAFLTFFTLEMIWFSYAFGDLTQGLVPIPLWIPQTTMGLGTILLTLALLVEARRLILGKEPTYLAVEREEAAERQRLVST